MLRFLTHKLKSQSLNEHRSQVSDNDDHDSGTESDEDHGDCETLDLSDDAPTSSHQVRLVPINNHASCSNCDVRPLADDNNSPTKTHEISEHNFDSVSCTSDYERHSLDFDRHSSEDELGIINKENVGETVPVYNWISTNRAGQCDSAGSTDEEVKDFLLTPQPVLLSASPPKGVQKVFTHKHNISPRLVLAHMAPVKFTTVTVSPRKRCHSNITPDKLSDSESEASGQRPCLDFEKMQQVGVYAPKKWKAGLTL